MCKVKQLGFIFLMALLSYQAPCQSEDVAGSDYRKGAGVVTKAQLDTLKTMLKVVRKDDSCNELKDILKGDTGIIARTWNNKSNELEIVYLSPILTEGLIEEKLSFMGYKVGRKKKAKPERVIKCKANNNRSWFLSLFRKQ